MRSLDVYYTHRMRVRASACTHPTLTSRHTGILPHSHACTHARTHAHNAHTRRAKAKRKEGNKEESCLSGPRAFAPLFPEMVAHALAADEFPMVMSLYFSLFARIILQAEDVFDVLLQQEAIKNQVRPFIAFSAFHLLSLLSRLSCVIVEKKDLTSHVLCKHVKKLGNKFCLGCSTVLVCLHQVGLV